MASQAKKRLTHSTYTVALICPLEVEMSAARYMLDEEHARLPTVNHGMNQYILGQLSGHNVVIASLPEGSQGTVSAATVAIHLARTFPSIKLRLLVGIRGGVPSEKYDIRLGDVVVSAPSGTSGGVIEYDLGKQTQTGFVRKGFLCPPPTEWRNVITRMKSDHRIESNKITAFLSDMLQKFPRLIDYRRPSSTKDILFQADYEHNPHWPTCANCDGTKVVYRDEREAPDEPVVFYGLIASGNRVIKHAAERDKISKDADGAICFEMEAAGLMNDFRCIVIRGISDYSDSHKNDDWHLYAAAAAAGLAKEILSYIDPISSEGKREVLQISNTQPPFNSNVENSSPLFSELPEATDTFCGRESELLLIAEALDPQKPGQKGIVLYGIGGSGKTQLALRYIKQYQQHYTAIIWINASTAEHTIQSFDEVADMFSSNWPSRDVPLAYRGSSNWRRVISRLRSTRYICWLLIIDSVDDLNQDEFRQYVPSCQYGSIIVTSTQYRAPEVLRPSRLEIDPLPVNSSHELLLTRAFGSILNANLSEEDYNTATTIVNELHGLPLAIEQASALLKTVFSLSDFINAYRSHYISIMNRYPPKGLLPYEKQQPIIVVFDMLYRSIETEVQKQLPFLPLSHFLGLSKFR